MKKFFFLAALFIAIGGFSLLYSPQPANAETLCCYYPPPADACAAGITDVTCLSGGGTFDAQCSNIQKCIDLAQSSGCCVTAGMCTKGVTQASCTAPGVFDANCEKPECVTNPATGQQGVSDAPPQKPFLFEQECKAQVEWYQKGLIAEEGKDWKGPLLAGISDKCYACGACGFCDVLQVANNVARGLFAIMGAVALIMFIWGASGFIMAFGNAEKIEGSKKVLTSALFGIFIIIMAWQLVHIIIFIFAGGDFDALKLFVTSDESYFWFNPCKL